MRVALIPFDPVVGDIHGNASRASKKARDAAAEGANLIVFPELAMCGYPPRDLLLRQGMAEACERAVLDVGRAVPECTVLIGSPRAVKQGERPVANSVAIMTNGAPLRWYDKRCLPTYDVFDELRYFTPGLQACVTDVGRAQDAMRASTPTGRVGILVCEDLWRAQDVNARATYGADALAQTVAESPELVVVMSASPFERGKHERHTQLLSAAAKRAGVPIASVNQFGAFDDLVFDGGATVAWPDGTVVQGKRWTDGALLFDVGPGVRKHVANPHPPATPHDFEDLWDAIVCGIRGYMARTGHKDVILGLSGGIDSALVAALAIAALGPEHVTGVLMPSVWSSPGSVSDAEELARRTGIRTLTLPIAKAHDLLAATLDGALRARGDAFSKLADENLQSRLRGMHLMALSNSTGALVVTTGNKSEYAAGYTTLYGDMCGALAPIGDVLKTDVWELSKWVNANAARAGFTCPPIPEASISKVPSAELRANQTDQDTLPPYADLDAIIRAWVDDELSLEETVARTGLPEDVVLQWTTTIDRAEYKRYQAAIIIKVSSRAFGRGRRMPLAQRWRPS